jgi:mRNA-degrading endonuclease toxin of MazEF toxin-antitoxin module
MRNGPTLTRFAAIFVVIESLLLIANGQSPSPAISAKAYDSTLPRKVVVPISTVNRFFPEVTRQASTGRNLTAVANAQTTRSVIYANSDSSKKVTITVDEYPTASDASSAYQEAVAKSKTVPGFKPVPAENLGQDAFIGTVTQGGETHIGLGTLHGTLIVGATLAGYDSTPENTAKLISLTREEERAAKAVMDRNRQK